MNRVVLIGRLTKDPELKFIPGKGTAVATGTIAINRRFSKENNEADFIPIVAWNKTAEILATYTKKGSLISVVGRIQTRSYEAKDGGRRYITEVVADEVEFLEKKGQSIDRETDNEIFLPDEGFEPIEDGDIPF
ncbi:MAG: single-stranded DNA-binding protein [Clostridiaceae bacterium]